MRLIVLASCVTVFGVVVKCHAVEVGYKFSGTVLNQFAPPYGKSIPAQTPVSGSFIYDTSASHTHNLTGCGTGTCKGYEQDITNGFSALFGDVLVRADNYIAAVFNDAPGLPPGTQSDIFSIRFISNLSPALILPLVVDGGDESVGWFNISLVADSTVFPDASLPNVLNPVDFPAAKRSGILSDMHTGEVDVLFSINSFTSYQIMRGDYNLDEQINASDFDVWRSTFGSTADLSADGNRNRSVAAEDYVIWRNSTINQTLVATHKFAAPEPLALLQLIAGCGLSVFTQRSRFYSL